MLVPRYTYPPITEQPLLVEYSITGGSVPEGSQPERGEKQWLPSRVFQP